MSCNSIVPLYWQVSCIPNIVADVNFLFNLENLGKFCLVITDFVNRKSISNHELTILLKQLTYLRQNLESVWKSVPCLHTHNQVKLTQLNWGYSLDVLDITFIKAEVFGVLFGIFVGVNCIRDLAATTINTNSIGQVKMVYQKTKASSSAASQVKYFQVFKRLYASCY